MDNCIFCMIKDGQIPSEVVYEDEKVFAFKDIHPVAPVHVLIISKEHIENIGAIHEGNGSCLVDIHLAANRIAEKLGIKDRGFRLLTNCGKEAGQTVYHLHYHLMGGRDLGPKIL